MRESARAWVMVAVVGLFVGCGGDDDGAVDADGRDAAAQDAGNQDAGNLDAGSQDAGSTPDANPEDADLADVFEALDAPGMDTGSEDTGPGTDSGPRPDAGPLCEGNTAGHCDVERCLSCPAGGPRNNHLCTRACRSDDDCTNRDNPHCNRPERGGEGICTPLDFTCRWGAICASPDTPIETPSGDRAIADLVVGDLVYTIDGDERVARPLVRVARTRVHEHRVRRLTLASGAVVEMSAGHPTVDGRQFADLRAGDVLGEEPILQVEEIPFEFAYTHDVLPDSSTGFYFTQGAAVGSTLAP